MTLSKAERRAGRVGQSYDVTLDTAGADTRRQDIATNVLAMLEDDVTCSAAAERVLAAVDSYDLRVLGHALSDYVGHSITEVPPVDGENLAQYVIRLVETAIGERNRGQMKPGPS